MYTILVVDDEKDIVSALEIYLKAEGYRVLSACNGKEALAAAAREDVHLILMDIMMPVMDGLSAMAQLRQTSNVPVILLTAKGEDTDKVLGLNVGADDYITKPFNPVELLARFAGEEPDLRLLPYQAVGVPCGLLLAVRVDEAAWGGQRRPRCLCALSPTPLSDGGGYHALVGGEHP